jgi:pectinesterase
MRLKLATASLVIAANALTSPPQGAVTVASSGGDFTSIQSAVNSGASIIFIQPGTYQEQVYIEEGKGAITIYGYSDSDDYSGNKVTITAGHSQDEGLNNDNTGTVRAHSDDFKMYNVNIVNSRGKGSQAIALSAYGDRQGYYGVSLQGYQDTVLSNDGHHFVSKSQILGATDFIFGQRALLWVEDTDIGVLSANLGYVTGK